MQKLEHNIPESVAKALSLPAKTKDVFRLFDSVGELADAADASPHGNHKGEGRSWHGASFSDAVRYGREGNLSLVAASDALLTKFERYAFETSAKGWRDDVCGSLPNIPAFIAGHPLNMRRRTRLESAAAPIAVIVDCTASAMIKPEDITTRGAAILALVRILSTRRPVELWAGASLDCDNLKNGFHTYARINTAPLDLGVAAFALTHAAYLRRLCFTLGMERGFAGHWPYSKHHSDPIVMPVVMAPAFSHVGETLCIEPMRVWDAIATEPETWLENKLADMMPQELAA